MSEQPAINWFDAPEGTTHALGKVSAMWLKLLGPGEPAYYWHAPFSGTAGWVVANFSSDHFLSASRVFARPMPEEVWSYTEDFKIHFPSLKALLADYADVDHPPSVGGSDTVYRGEWVTPDPAKYVIKVEDVLEHMCCQASDEVEDMDHYPDVTEEATDELKALLEAWARKHAQPDFRIVTNITPHRLSEVY